MSGSLIDNPNAAWVTNGVNAVLQTDLVEGMATGASHGGVGNSNAGAQVLANRTALLYNQQQTDRANIAALLSQQSADVGNITTLLNFVGRFVISGSYPEHATVPMQNGYSLIIKFGQQNTTGNATTVTFDAPFPNGCIAVYVNEAGAGTYAQNPPFPTLYAVQGLASGNATIWCLVWSGNSAPGWVGGGSGRTFNWLAIGY